MHDEIRKFYLEGELGQNVVTTRERLIFHLENMMRDYGFVPSIDNEPQFTLDYDADRESFNFKLTVYGVKIGDNKSWQISGVTSGKEIPKYTALAK